MDIITHAVVGAATGNLIGRPIIGAFIAVVPDLVLGFKRKRVPTSLYKLTHSPIPMSFLVFGAVGVFTQDPMLSAVLVLCYWSHIVLDLFTHADGWGPQLFSPFVRKHYSLGGDWEWFNGPWWAGLLVSAGWIYVCMSLATQL